MKHSIVNDVKIISYCITRYINDNEHYVNKSYNQNSGPYGEGHYRLLSIVATLIDAN